MKEIQVFNNDQFGQVRTAEQSGKIYFCGKDVAEALGYRDTVNALKQHCKQGGVVKHHLIDNLGRKQSATFINEGNLYRLIVHSKLSSAEQFESWVFDEVLPSIRKTGGYAVKPNDEIKARMLITREENVKIRKANLLYKVAKECDIESYRNVLHSHITSMLTGKALLPLPVTDSRVLYTAGDIAAMLGISSAKVGKLANRNGLKTEQYGVYVWDKSPYSAHECKTFRYYIEVVPELKKALEKEVA